MDRPFISTLSRMLKETTGDNSDQPAWISPHDLSLDSTQQTTREMPSQTVQNSISQAELFRRTSKEPKLRHSNQIPFRQPARHVVDVWKCSDQRNSGRLTVQIPAVANFTIPQQARSAFKCNETTTSEVLELESSQSPSPEPLQAVVSKVSTEAAEDASPTSTNLLNEPQFHFNDSLQVNDHPVTSPSEQKSLLRDDPTIPITYDKVWDPFAPPSRKGARGQVVNLQSYPSPAPTAHSMSFSLPSNYTESNIHHAPPTLPIASITSNRDPQIPAWKIASQSIVAAPKGRELARLEDCLSEDIAIRAVMDGWNSIGESWELPPFWRVIRLMDELIFGKFNPVVRLASLRVVHLLMRYHSDPSPERAKNMPKFYNLKGLDFDEDYSIGNFLPWPGIRALAQNPRASFRSDKFFQLETTTLKILWPFSLQECYTRDSSTGLFKISPSFDKRIYDINAWTFEPKMFESFPELYGVAPAFNSIPGKVDEVRKRCWSTMAWDGGGEDEGKGKEIQMIGKDARPGVDSRGLKWHKITDKGKEVIYFTFW